MSQKLIESVDINNLISTDINDFIPVETDFGQVVAWYVNSLESFNLQTTTNKTLFDFLDHSAACWILRVKSPEDKVKLIFRRLVASIVLKINDFSNVLVEQCCKFVTKDELRSALKTIAQQANLFETRREKYKDVLETQLTLVTKINTQNQFNSSSSQNLPKYWIWCRSPEDWRRTIYLDKKTKNDVYSVKMGGMDFRSYRACPLFDSVQQAEVFLDNFKDGKSATKREPSYLQTFNYKIIEITDTKHKNLNFITSTDLQNYVLVDTMCGKAYLDCRITF